MISYNSLIINALSNITATLCHESNLLCVGQCTHFFHTELLYGDADLKHILYTASAKDGH